MTKKNLENDPGVLFTTDEMITNEHGDEDIEDEDTGQGAEVEFYLLDSGGENHESGSDDGRAHADNIVERSRGSSIDNI